MSHTPVRFREAVGVPDGSRTVFETHRAYRSGSLRVLINGTLRRADLDDGFVETAPPEFEMRVAPATGDTVWTFYREA
jgi:hypothetical protein